MIEVIVSLLFRVIVVLYGVLKEGFIQVISRSVCLGWLLLYAEVKEKKKLQK